MNRRRFLAHAGLLVVPPAVRRRGAPDGSALLTDVRVTNGGRPWAGDGALLATVSPRTARGRARVSFRLGRDARVRLEVVRTDTIRIGRPAAATVWQTERPLRAGTHTLEWRPSRSIAPRTYVLRLTATDAAGRRHVIDNTRPRIRHAPVVRVLGVDAALPRSSYRPGDATDLVIACDAPRLHVQVFHYGGGSPAAERDLRTNGIAVTPPATVEWGAHADRAAPLRLLRAGQWPSGLYFVRAATDDGRVGYAPFILRPSRLGASRVAVVLATNTWQAYNFHDADGDGWGDSWYVSDAIRSVDATRPYLDFGVPFRFRDWDLTFIAWANRTGKVADYLSDDDIDAAGGDALRRAYDLIVFPGHEEYVTDAGYRAVKRFRDLGGNLAFLSANNLFWRVRREGSRIVKERLWRDVGRPEASVVGVQYVGSDHGQRQAPYRVTGADAAPWVFQGTGLENGASFGRYGIEIDRRAPSSPRNTRVLARIDDLLGPGRSAEMTLYETAAGARVFAAGVLNFAASIESPPVARLVDNVWHELSRR